MTIGNFTKCERHFVSRRTPSLSSSASRFLSVLLVDVLDDMRRMG